MQRQEANKTPAGETHGANLDGAHLNECGFDGGGLLHYYGHHCSAVGGAVSGLDGRWRGWRAWCCNQTLPSAVTLPYNDIHDVFLYKKCCCSAFGETLPLWSNTFIDAMATAMTIVQSQIVCTCLLQICSSSKPIPLDAPKIVARDMLRKVDIGGANLRTWWAS